MTPCLEWQGSTDPKGYGRFNAGTGVAPRFMLAHRYAMEIIGSLDSRPVLHACDNPPCCNPDHLRSGTRAENNAEMRAKRRHAFGERIGCSKLTASQVVEIRSRHNAGEQVPSIIGDYPVAYRTLVDVVNGVTWKHIHERQTA